MPSTNKRELIVVFTGAGISAASGYPPFVIVKAYGNSTMFISWHRQRALLQILNSCTAFIKVVV